MSTTITKIDPIRDKYYVPLQRAESWSVWLFYATAIVSVAVLFVDKGSLPTAYLAAQTAFVAFALASALLNLMMRLYLGPRAQEKRVSDFVSNAFNVQLTSERTVGYFCNNATDPPRKLALQLLENCLFTKETVRLMCSEARLTFGIYLLIWLVVVINRGSPIDLVVWVCQIVFGGEILSAWLRVEWLRHRTESIFEALLRQYQSAAADTPFFLASSVDAFARYEADKATSGVTLSNQVFEKHNDRLSKEWDRIRATLGA